MLSRTPCHTTQHSPDSTHLSAVPTPQSMPLGHSKLLTHTLTRVFWAAPCLLIPLMTILKHMLTIIAPKCFRTNLIFLVFWFRAMLPSVSPLASAENPVNRCLGMIPYPPCAREPRTSRTPRIVLSEPTVTQPGSDHTLEARESWPEGT